MFSQEEDFVEYSLYPVKEGEDLPKLKEEVVERLNKYTSDYMWHQEAFHLDILKKCLYGKVFFGDNIEDEWFIISLLLEISKQLEVIIRVTDQDGEVLLIEAADFLPKWAQDPETCDKRVYIFGGQIHLIPVADRPSQLTPLASKSITIKVQDAITTIIKYNKVTCASLEVQKCIKQRLGTYPGNWKQHQHVGHFLLPNSIRTVLNQAPHLVSPAIRCFYTRDNRDVQVCRKMHYSDDSFQVKSLKLTKCLYAMLGKQNFLPDKKQNWPNNINNCKAALLGYKLTCGFEILASHQNGKKRLEAYMDKLEKSGFFQGELKGSKKYVHLYQEALKHFEDNNVDKEEEFSYSHELSNLLKSCNISEDTKEVLVPQDDDSWMDVQQDSFDDMLAKHFKVKNNVSEKDIPAEMKNFLKSMSDLEGVEESSGKKEKSLDFDPDQFESALRKVLDIPNEDEDDSDSEEEDDDVDLDKETVSDYYKEMDEELKGTKVHGEEEEWDRPLDIDSRVLNNLLESFKSQEGLPGPASTLLEPLGFNLANL